MDLKRVNSLQYPVQIVPKICAKVFSGFHGSFPLRFSILGFRWWINCYPQKRETESTRQREGVLGREVRRTTAKRDPGSPVRKLRLRNTLVSIPQQLAEENEREKKRERKTERNRQREEGEEKEIRGAKPDGTPGISRWFACMLRSAPLRNRIAALRTEITDLYTLRFPLPQPPRTRRVVTALLFKYTTLLPNVVAKILKDSLIPPMRCIVAQSLINLIGKFNRICILANIYAK